MLLGAGLMFKWQCRFYLRLSCLVFWNVTFSSGIDPPQTFCVRRRFCFLQHIGRILKVSSCERVFLVSIIC